MKLMTAAYKGPLRKNAQTSPIRLWNDSISIPEATSSIAHGTPGGTRKWSKLIADGVVISPSYSWQLCCNTRDVEVRSRMNGPVDRRIGHDLSKKSPDLVCAHPEGVIGLVQFDHFACTRRSLRQFIEPCEALDNLVQAVAIPNPDFA